VNDWISALFVLAGVIVGGLLTGGVTLALDTRREKRAARAAARLVVAELNEIGARLNAAVAAGVYGPEAGGLPLPDREWLEGRTLLAVALSDEEWDAVAHAYLNVVRVAIALQMNDPPRRPIDQLLDSDRTIYTSVRDSALKAIGVLDGFLKQQN
jgi:hypothetical protein